MKDMLKYLNEVEEMMGGNDLAQIRKMIRYQTETLDHHILSYDKIKSHVDDMNKGKSTVTDPRLRCVDCTEEPSKSAARDRRSHRGNRKAKFRDGAAA